MYVIHGILTIHPFKGHLSLKDAESTSRRSRPRPRQSRTAWPDGSRAQYYPSQNLLRCSGDLCSTPQLPFEEPQIPSNRDHKALNRGTLEGRGSCRDCNSNSDLGYIPYFLEALRTEGRAQDGGGCSDLGVMNVRPMLGCSLGT